MIAVAARLRPAEMGLTTDSFVGSNLSSCVISVALYTRLHALAVRFITVPIMSGKI